MDQAVTKTQSRGPAGQAGTVVRQRRKAQRPAEIVDAALDEFIERGYGSASLESIARRAGITKGTIYLYFANKQAVFNAVVSHHVQPLFQEAEQAIAGFQGSTVDLLREHLRQTYIRLVTQEREREMLRLLISEGARFPELTEIYHREVVSRSANIARLIVWRGMARGEFRQTALDRFPQIINGPALAALMWLMLFGGSQDLDIEAYAQTHADLLLYGLLPRPGETADTRG
ncbi:TetR/AcrR family transcriptional regulator [Zavarzinia sp. CC-PAN008]|uniref:TetR/AcrR family transcriptional regulator n=1 Tax=Zavarzinia sp. CC-PAN008 TaxID=3243332 RepID=UPI003F74241C